MDEEIKQICEAQEKQRAEVRRLLEELVRKTEEIHKQERRASNLFIMFMILTAICSFFITYWVI